MPSKKRIAMAAGLLLIASFLLAQGPNQNLGNDIPVRPAPAKSDSVPQKNSDISLDVNLVNLDVVVIDKNGNPIGGMEKRHFKIFDDNVEQKITNFNTVDTPL